MVTAWIEQETRRIECLSNEGLIEEIHRIMTGESYSWQSINLKLRELNSIDYSMCREWKYLCDRKRAWDENVKENHISRCFDASAILAELRQGCAWNFDAQRYLLMQLKIVPIRAGLGEAGR